MISKTVSFKTTDGNIHASIEDAQRHEIVSFFNRDLETPIENYTTLEVANFIMDNRDRMVDLLTTKANSKPSAGTLGNSADQLGAVAGNSMALTKAVASQVSKNQVIRRSKLKQSAPSARKSSGANSSWRNGVANPANRL